MFRLTQISDTHLAEEHPEFTTNFDALATYLRDSKPDLIVNTGDISAHGELGRNIGFAKGKHDELGLDWLAVPGNHDVGNDPATAKSHPASSQSVARWREIVGPDFWTRDVPGWRLIGLDTLITDTDLPEAQAQLAFLEEALATAGSRAIGILQHKPLCVHRMDETGLTYWSVLEKPRAAILKLLERKAPRFIASGHVHQWWDRGVVEGLRQIWAPAIAFHVGDDYQEIIGTKPQGHVEHELHEDGTHTYRLVEVPGLLRHDIGVMPTVYGQLPKLA